MRGRSWFRAAAAAGALCVLLFAMAPPIPVAAATEANRTAARGSHAGYCTGSDRNAVTLVVDYQDLGGSTVVRCAADLRSGATGWDVLQATGIATVGTVHDGAAFICRLNGRPSQTEPVPIPGNSSYTEQCVNTPPTAAYWSYWWAAPGGQWTYSRLGVMSNRVKIGGFEGWSFSHNASAQTIPQPGVAPVLPAPPTTAAAPPTAPAAPPTPPSTSRAPSSTTAPGPSTTTQNPGSSARPVATSTGSPGRTRPTDDGPVMPYPTESPVTRAAEPGTAVTRSALTPNRSSTTTDQNRESPATGPGPITRSGTTSSPAASSNTTGRGTVPKATSMTASSPATPPASRFSGTGGGAAAGSASAGASAINPGSSTPVTAVAAATGPTGSSSSGVWTGIAVIVIVAGGLAAVVLGRRRRTRS